MRGNEMSKVKRQHYVPKCYLKNFTMNDKLYVFDKALEKSWNSTIDSISSEMYFYDINVVELFEKYPELFDEKPLDSVLDMDEQEVEKFFSDKIEGRYATLLRNIISTFTLSQLSNIEGKAIIDIADKYEFSILVAFQIVRTREFREGIIQGSEVVTKKIFDVIARAEGNEELTDNVDFVFNRDFESLEHARFIMDYENIEKLAGILYHHIWIFAYNNTANPFYTSDNPLTKKANIEHPIMSYSGYASTGIELALPINSKIILMMYEKEHFKTFAGFDMKYVGFITEENVLYFNSIQVNTSYRQVYSATNDFSLAKNMCKVNEKLKDINYKRIVSN
jgi:hypothetical protein